MKMFCSILLFATITIDPGEALYKRWIQNTNLDNPKNWNTGKLPCGNDILHLPEKLSSVVVGANISTTELVLPVNGELVLADYTSISFPTHHSNDANCPGQDVSFSRNESLQWFDANNWCEVGSLGGKCLARQPSRLDTERVPCQHDDVIFPKNGRYYVDLESDIDIFVSTLTVRGKSFTTDRFRSFITKGEGKSEFIRNGKGVPGTLNIQQESCRDDAGCICGNDVAHLQEIICKNKICPELMCNTPLTVDGQCCPFCGATLKMDYVVGFVFSRLNRKLMSIYRQSGSEDVMFVMSRTVNDRILLLLKDDDDGQMASGVALDMQKALTKGSKKYGITDLEMSTSQNSGPKSHAQTGELSGGGVTGIIIAILAFVVVAIVCMVCLIDRRQCVRFRQASIWSKFNRMRDEDGLGSGGIELESPNKHVLFGQTPRAGVQSVPTGFDNPMYATVNGEKGADNNANTDDVAVIGPADVTFIRSGSTDNTAFNNPLYGAPAPQPALPSYSKLPAYPAVACNITPNSGISNTLQHDSCGSIPLPSPSDNGDSKTGFTNPLFDKNGGPDAIYDDATIKFNPMYSDEGVEEDSSI